jgi:multidrug efflux system outer membrane protein
VRRALAAALAIFALAPGCAVGPDYERPAVEVPADWHWKKAEPRAAAPRGPWWKIFRDAELDRLEELAAAQNQDLAAALARAAEARALAAASAGDFFPQASLDPTAERQSTSANEVAFGFKKRFVYNTFTLPIDLSYEVDVWGRVRRTYAAAGDRAAASEADFETVRLGVAADVAADHFLVRALDAEAAVLERTLKLRRESLELLRAQLSFGAIDALDVARAETDVATTVAALADVRRRRFELVNALALLCGRVASGFEEAARPLEGPPPEVPALLPSELLERRPDIARAERLMAAANEDIGVAKAAFFPRIALTASGGFESSELGNIFHWQSSFWQIGANLAQPLFTGGRASGEYEAVQARYAEALAAYRQQVLVAMKDVEDALLDLRFLAEQAQAQADAVAAAHAVSALSTQRYEAGLVSYLDVFDAQRTELAAEQQAAQVLGQRLVATVRLVKALGGGWRAAAR